LLRYFDPQTKEYRRIVVEEQVEGLSLLGDVAVAAEGPTLHVHAVLGTADGSVVGGHLLEGYVRPTLEVILIQPRSYLRKRRDPVTGLALIAVDVLRRYAVHVRAREFASVSRLLGRQLHNCGKF
jgi:uncharacterized protein